MRSATVEALRRLPIRGTLLNSAAVAVGALLGLWVGSALPQDLLNIALAGLGFVTICIGVKLFLGGTNVLTVALAVGVGGIVGQTLGISAGLDAFATWARASVGGGPTFNEALITTSVLFCIGPMTLLGCVQDGLERNIELLAIKSVMDGIASVFFAATLGPGVLVTAVVVLVVQGTLTLCAGGLRPLTKDQALMADTMAAGGPIMLAIGFGLAGIRKFPAENFLPALALAPIFALSLRRVMPTPRQEPIA